MILFIFFAFVLGKYFFINLNDVMKDNKITFPIDNQNIEKIIEVSDSDHLNKCNQLFITTMKIEFGNDLVFDNEVIFIFNKCDE